jgi:ketosteroid isomerase-like protein
MTTAPVAFDLAALSRAIEERDAASQLALYADDAEVRLVDQDNPPSAPRILRGKPAIAAWIQDVSARDMTHRVERTVVQGDRAAFTESCRYPDGTAVLCSAVLDLDQGLIVREVGLQAWDS